MSRSRHGHKHTGRAKCGVCSGTIGAAARQRETQNGRQDLADGIEERDAWDVDSFADAPIPPEWLL